MQSCTAVFKNMEKTMQNREASFGIYITNTEEQLQGQIGLWQLFKEKDLIVTHSSMLEASIKIAKLLTSMSNEAVEGVDTLEIEKHLILISDMAKRTQSVKRNLTNIEDSISALRLLENERKTAIDDAINGIRNEIAKATAIAA